MSEEADSNRTHFAMKALSLADYFRVKIGDKRVSGYRVELAVPDGPSTAGGKQALQHIRLVPDKPGAPTLTAGNANQADRTCELRSWEHMQALHAQRFRGKRAPLDKVAYNELLKRMQVFFGEQRMAVVLLDSPLPVRYGPSAGAYVMAVALMLAVAGAVFFILDMKK